ncbi:molybdopterin oxidoreductase Fe4S4 region [Klebsiella aerogenes]|nr:molybdopterin oxidoreductase Fe4S4 region [Klebsiella aerogenes]
MDVSRRKFFKICAGGMAGTTAAALGFAPKMALAQARNFKLLRAKEIPQHLHLLAPWAVGY